MSAPTARPLGIGIIGAGTIVNRHAVAYLSLPQQARLVGVSDIDLLRAETARRRYGMEVAAKDYRELLDRPDVDVVSICTRPNTHLAIVRDALAAGKHVLCEKPIAHNLADADALIADCERHPESRVACLYQWRADPAVRFAVQLVETGQVGRPLLADVLLRNWRPDAYYTGGARESFAVDGGGVLMVMGIHQLDALLALLGEASEVAGQMDRYLRPSEGEDALVGWIRFRSGALATLRFSVLDQRDYFQVDLLAQRASLRLRGVYFGSWEIEARDRRTERDLRALGRRQAPPSRFPASRNVVRAMERLYGLRGRPWLPPRSWWHTPYVERFLEAVRDGTPVPVSPSEARRSLELAIALYQSALTDTVVRLPLGPESPLYAGVDPKAMPWVRPRKG